MIDSAHQLSDIYDIWYQPVTFYSWKYLIIYGIFAVICTLVSIILYKKYKKSYQRIDCSVQAYRDLDTLKKMHIATNWDSKDSYFRLSSIIKQYLACRYDKLFFTLTDKEIIRLAELYMMPAQVRLLQKIFQDMVLIKFEHQVISYEKFQEHLALAYEFIQNSTQIDDTKGK